MLASIPADPMAANLQTEQPVPMFLFNKDSPPEAVSACVQATRLTQHIMVALIFVCLVFPHEVSYTLAAIFTGTFLSMLWEEHRARRRLKDIAYSRRTGVVR